MEKEALAELPALEVAYAALSAGRGLWEVKLTDEQRALLKPLALLTAKPVLYAANVTDHELTGDEGPHLKALRAAVAKSGEHAQIVPFSAKIEAELAELPPADREDFLASLGLTSAGLDRLIRAGYELLGLQTYFTAGEQEVRAWTIHKGDRAPGGGGRDPHGFRARIHPRGDGGVSGFHLDRRMEGREGERGGAIGRQRVRRGGWGCTTFSIQRLTPAAVYSTHSTPPGLTTRVIMTLRMRGSMVVAGSLLLLGAETPQHSHTASSDGWTFTWQTVTTLDAEGRHTTDSASLPVQVARGRVRIRLPGRLQ